MNAKEYINNTGCHMAVSENVSGGLADEGTGVSAFNEGKKAVCGSFDYDSRTKQVAMQESLHTFTRWDIIKNTDLIDSNEHDLGTIYSDDDVSPMAAGYAQGWGAPANNGKCDTGKWASWGRSNQLTSCTVDAIAKTINEEF